MSIDTKIMDSVLMAVREERFAQYQKWGVQELPHGTNALGVEGISRAEVLRRRCQKKADRGLLTWKDVLLEEVAEAMEEWRDEKLREELVQVAAVCCQWIESIDRAAEKKEGAKWNSREPNRI